jgi:hypothetical protein
LDTRTPTRLSRGAAARSFLPHLLLVTALPVLLTTGLWGEIWRGVRAQAWDGSGHYALARVYADTIFPDTFGWTDAFFAGTALPNFYPPLFYWLVALLQRSGLAGFNAAFKLVLALPMLLLPAALWLLAWRLAGRDRAAATCAAVAAVPLLVDVRLSDSLGVMGLSYTSTFLLGLYTQPLGFVLLAAWYVLYASEGFARGAWRAPLASLLLALALLANFFSATVAALFVLTTLTADALGLARARAGDERRGARGALAAHLLSPLAGLGLTLFWLAPLLASYDYVVTRPQFVTFDFLVPAPLWVWYALAAAGAVLWVRRPAAFAARPFVAACALLAAGIFLAAAFAPGWFPFHPPRLTSTLNFLLAAPVGNALAAALRLLGFARRSREGRAGTSAPQRARRGGFGLRMQSAFSVAILAPLGFLLLLGVLTPPPTGLAFYDESEWARVSPVLDFAAGRRDGRYLVETQSFNESEAAHDSRAINAYLGAQGNASLSLFFREGSPNVLFLNPLVDAFSPQPDSYGISSVLADDIDFKQRTVASHIERARLYGVKYLVVRSQTTKDRLTAEHSVGSRRDFGQWSVFELSAPPPPGARSLAHKPALVVSDLSLKLRRRTDYGFVRLAEEQFASGWFDVALARSPETRLDRLEVPEGFGSVVVDAYRYDDAEKAFARLRDVARVHHVVLLSADDPVFRRVQAAPGEFPQAEVIERQPEEEGAERLDTDHPTRSYDDTLVRLTWRRLQKALDGRKVPTGAAADAPLEGGRGPRAINLAPPAGTNGAVPALLATSFHPDWRRADGERVYEASPFLMLTFVRAPAALVFERGPAGRAGLYASAASLLLLLLFTAWGFRRRGEG